TIINNDSAPTVGSFSPTVGQVGTSVLISGTNFVGVTAVRFNVVNATFNLLSSTSIRTTVPFGATTGPISIVTSAGTATSSSNFTVTTGSSLPTITALTPNSGIPGTSVTISGSNLTGAATVKFNNLDANFIVLSSTSIKAIVPLSATTGKISVTTPTGT